jgi:environmental stress-induced protein Ves
MIILRAADYRTEPWKNGGGVTREILREPVRPGAFDWRLSLATIESAGPFSAFEGYQRTLVLVRGAGIELNFAQHGTSRLSAPGQTATFDGEWQTSCTLLDGPSTDLNLIVSKERAQSTSRVAPLTDGQTIQTADWTEVLLCCLSGAIQLTNTAGEVELLQSIDVARCTAADGAISCTAQGREVPNLFVAAIRRRDG